MKVLVVNAGSSSHKLCLYSIVGDLPTDPPMPLWTAQIDWYPSYAVWAVDATGGKALSDRLPLPSDPNPKQAILSQVLHTLWQGPTQVIAALDEITIVGHRVVHGGAQYQDSVVVTNEVKAAIAQLIPLAPVHNPVNLEGIELMEQLLPQVPQVAVFDTAFHHSMSDVATVYPGPYDWRQQGIRRYGFHGISHQYCTHRAAQLLERDVTDLRLIICHLGNGGSLCAVRNGRSIDTTMGFTPLDGLMMGTRSGAVDPGILIHLMRQGYSADQLDHLLNKKSGLKGISMISHDLREIEAAALQGHPQAKLAMEVYIHRFKACFGAMMMSLGGVDAIVFTAGIGEHAATIRTTACESMAFLDIHLDLDKNAASPVDQDIAMEKSKARILVIHTQEDWAIAQSSWHCFWTLDNSIGTPPLKSSF